MHISAPYVGLLWRSLPVPQRAGCYGHGLDSALEPRGLKRDGKQLALDPLKWCLGLSHTPQDPPYPAWSVVGACVCTTSHQGGVCGGGGEGCGFTVEVGENFSEGIHCPLTGRTA